MHDLVVEEREEESLISFTGNGNTQRRKAHFLKPSTAIEGSIFGLPSHTLSALPSSSNPKSWPLRVNFHFWIHPGVMSWKKWVSKMVPLHQSAWKKVGIYEAIMTSTYRIHKDDVLILGLVEKWCCETKSFIFPWGEATITLEDLLVSWGYPVLGSSVLGVSASGKTIEMEQVEQRLEDVRIEFVRSKSQKASCSSWLKRFMESGVEFEHEAFLAYWLSRFVLPKATDSISTCVFPIAVSLARGNKVAIAQAVLASIYRDLSLLKSKINVLSKLDSIKNSGDLETVNIKTPFSIVQIWAWERFSELSPKNPNLITIGEPRLARWHDVKFSTVEENVRSILDSSADHFDWRPYAKDVKNFDFPKFYKDSGTWVLVDSDSDEELKSFVECIRVSDLKGLDCVEWYYPNRVGMQFGMDQDIPICPSEIGDVGTSKSKVYVPPRCFMGSVTTRYLKWWGKSLEKESKFVSPILKHRQDPMKNAKRRKKRKKVVSSDSSPESSKESYDDMKKNDHVLEKKFGSSLFHAGYCQEQNKMETDRMKKNETNSAELFKFSSNYAMQKELETSTVAVHECDDDDDKRTIAEIYKISKNPKNDTESLNGREISSSSSQDNGHEVVILLSGDSDNDMEIAGDIKHVSSEEKGDNTVDGEGGVIVLSDDDDNEKRSNTPLEECSSDFLALDLIARVNRLNAAIKSRITGSSTSK